ncbi:NfeD family protein [Rubripirellula amarantea]|nr:NfeD family protein [Rubripirellula amarantea]
MSSTTSPLTFQLRATMARLACLACMLMCWIFEPQVACSQILKQDQPAGRKAVIIPLHEDINPLSGGILQRKFDQAIAAGAEVVIFDINSPGGRVDVTFELMDMLLEAKSVETVAMIERDAISGAALFSLACDKIIMLPGARLGDAGVIVLGPSGEFRYAEAKSRSMVAQKARDTARATGRPEVLAEKMTDKDMIVFKATNKVTGESRYFSDKEWETLEDGDQWTRGKQIREGGKEMFFIANGERLLEFGIADQTFNDRSELGELLNVRTPIEVLTPTWAESIARILNNGWVTFFLITIGLIAIAIELSAPGISVGGLTSLLCFSLFFWSRFAAGTSGWLEVTLFALGLIFIACEFFVIPGFGIAGLGGIVLTLGSLVMASQRFLIPSTADQLSGLGYDVLTVLGAFVGFLVAAVVLANYIGEIPGLSRLTLQPPVVMETSTGIGRDQSSQAAQPGWQRVSIGDVGRASGPLRPSGRILVEDYLVDVVTEGDFVDADSEVRVIAKQGAKVIVREV